MIARILTKVSLIVIIFLPVFILIPANEWEISLAQNNNAEFFEETGHWVSGKFYEFYYAIDDPIFIYGYPITEAFEDPLTHVTVQYFERARFELHQNKMSGTSIQRTTLGKYLYQSHGDLPLKNITKCKGNSYNDKQVCHAFLDFYLKHGKDAQFGIPLSNLEIHDGMIVQYFQLARFEWHPELPPHQRVVISNLGIQYFHMMGNDPNLLNPPAGTNIIGITSLNANAFPVRPVTGKRGIQTITILVENQYKQPVKNAKIDLLIQLPSGTELRNSRTMLTDVNGIAKYSFSFKSTLQGSVRVQITVRINDQIKITETSFRIW